MNRSSLLFVLLSQVLYPARSIGETDVEVTSSIFVRLVRDEINKLNMTVKFWGLLNDPSDHLNYDLGKLVLREERRKVTKLAL